ncbi:HAMP domain-containing sensor histidine kinase [Thalassotalea sp. G2M2-11]|uniref:sensor histidine kinase n=1 Tax=Thalassotalea sp. G2M2-11 TaxID=2787627 RepID=UPI0019D2306D|nr:HAMP domain-containing sensor histidine kinase [Thalassotalea sp. G2M2-11]
MSLRRYLFSLVGTLIILFTLMQLALLYWLEQNVQADVMTNVKRINETALDLALDKVFIHQDEQVLIKNGVVDTAKSQLSQTEQPPSAAQTDTNIEVLAFKTPINTGQQTIIEIEASSHAQVNDSAEHPEDKHNAKTTPHISKRVLRKEFKQQIEKILTHQLPNVPKNANSTIVVKDGEIKQHWITEFPIVAPDKTSRLIQSMQYSLILGAVVALFFAYWLSVQFNRPLKALANGFKQLAKGNYQHQVNVIGVQEIRTTITQFNQMTKRLDQLSKAEQHHQEIAHLAELGEVSRGLAHALRNPMHTIGLAIEQLQDKDIAPAQKTKLLTTIQHKITNIEKSIKALLTLTSSGIDRTDIIPLRAIIQDIILEYKSGQNLPINFDVHIDSNMIIHGAESEVRSILHTVIINACEASMPNDTVLINADMAGSKLCVTVVDHGKGIDEKIASQLYQPHVSTKPEGAGMGLYIAKRLVSLHYQGDITLTNNPAEQSDKGCTAKVTFAMGALQSVAPTQTNNEKPYE